MRMGWFLPLACLIGVLSTQDAWIYHRDHPHAWKWGSIVFCLFVGWFPLMVWIVNVLWPQN